MRYMLTAEAARVLGITPNAVRLMESRGVLPAERTDSGVRLFDRQVVKRIARARKAAAAEEHADAAA